MLLYYKLKKNLINILPLSSNIFNNANALRNKSPKEYDEAI